MKTYNNLSIGEIKEYLNKNEYSYRRANQCAFLQLQYPEVWKTTLEHHRKEKLIIKNQLPDDLITYIKEGYNPELLLNPLLSDEKILKDYGKCTELAGSLWAFLGSALYRAPRTTNIQEE
jgi:hypothetical protein